MTRPLRLALTAAFLCALALGGGSHLVRAEAEAPSLAYREKVPQRSRGDEGEYRLDRLPILSRVVLAVKDQYVDPSRFEPKQMVVSALEMVEKTVAEVMVQGDAKSQKLVLTVGNAQRDIDISGVDSIWKIRTVLGEAMGFIQDHLVAHDDLRQIEYAAVNGMLSTLDPHTVLLEPKAFKDMKLSTKGEFGGLGFVIAMRDGNLTVVKVLKGTPAQRAGVKAKDVITKIEEQSTVEMDLQDAVDRLRGKPQTRVSITIARASTEPKRLALVREIIKVETVPQAKLLEGGIGYIRLSQFSANSRDDLLRSVLEQRAQAGGKLNGLVLDLRGNPGGLLEQAVQVSDLFLDSGVIVKTVGGGRTLELKEASADSDDLIDLPLVVIVNNSSASASEIVAGALKNDGRALIIGRQTFGKGSVQVLHDFGEPGRPNEEAALKLTIAQYLTPGDVSIQEVGITPDVLLLPGRALKEQVNFFAPPRSMGEIDLDRHLSNPGARDEAEERAEVRKKRVEKASLELRYLIDEKEDPVAKALKKAASEDAAESHAELTPEQVEDEEADADPDRVVEDYQIKFARELLHRAPFPDRARLLDAASTLVAERHDEEARRLEARLKEMGVDWTPPPAAAAAGAPRAVVSFSPSPSKDAKAGEVLPWTVTVENRGDAPFRRLRGWTISEKNPLLDRREFLFGTIRPGERRSWTVPVRMPRSLDSRRDEVNLTFEEEGGHAPPDVATSVGVVEVAKPAFAFSVQVDDQQGGNGDGLAQRGETFTFRVDVRNSGAGASGKKTYVALRNLGDEKLFVKKGREIIGSMKPGEVKTARLEVELRKGSHAETLPFRLSIVDEKTDEYLSDKVEWPVAKEEPSRAAAAGSVRVDQAEVVVRGGASKSAPAVATARKGTVLPTDARFGDFQRVEWQKGRFGFVASSDVKAVKSARSGTPTVAWQREPPRIAISPDPTRGAPVVDADTIRLSGSAVVPPTLDESSRLRDMFVFVNDQKVFFKVVPEETGAKRMEFQTDLPLKPGQNQITVVAREDEEFQSHRSLVVFRRPVAAVAQDASGKEPPRAQQ